MKVRKLNESKWTDAYDEILKLMDYFPDEEKISCEAEKIYLPHKGDPDWDLAWERWNDHEYMKSPYDESLTESADYGDIEIAVEKYFSRSGVHCTSDFIDLVVKTMSSIDDYSDTDEVMELLEAILTYNNDYRWEILKHYLSDPAYLHWADVEEDFTDDILSIAGTLAPDEEEDY